MLGGPRVIDVRQRLNDFNIVTTLSQCIQNFIHYFNGNFTIKCKFGSFPLNLSCHWCKIYLFIFLNFCGITHWVAIIFHPQTKSRKKGYNPIHFTLSAVTLKYIYSKQFSILPSSKLQCLRFTCVINGLLTYAIVSVLALPCKNLT